MSLLNHSYRSDSNGTQSMCLFRSLRGSNGITVRAQDSAPIIHHPYTHSYVPNTRHLHHGLQAWLFY
jgi:hypothetical protein